MPKPCGTPGTKVSDAASEGAWLTALSAMVTGARPMQRLDTYVREHCGAEYSFTGAGADPSNTPEPAESPSAPDEPAEDEVGIPLPDGGDQGWQRSEATVNSGCAMEFSTESPAGTIFDPVTGTFGALPVPDIDPNEERMGGRCIGIGAADSLRVVNLVRTRTPASGLDPARDHRRFVSLAAARRGRNVTRKWPLAWEGNELRGAGEVVIVGGGGDSGEQTAALNGESGEVLWRRKKDAELRAVAPGVVALGEQYEAGVKFVDPTTGKARARADVRNLRELPTGLAITRYGSGYSEVPAWFADGKLRDVARDVVTDFGGRLLLYDDKGFEVVDAATLTSQLKRTGAAYSGLGVTSTALAGQYLYLTSDDGPSVIDVQTATKVADQWSLRPTERLSSGWTAVRRGEEGEIGPAPVLPVVRSDLRTYYSASGSGCGWPVSGALVVRSGPTGGVGELDCCVIGRELAHSDS